MTRDTVMVTIRALPGGIIRAIPLPTGNIPVYRDQLSLVNDILGRAHSIEEAREFLYSSANGYDKHHNDPTQMVGNAPIPTRPTTRRPKEVARPEPVRESSRSNEDDEENVTTKKQRAKDKPRTSH